MLNLLKNFLLLIWLSLKFIAEGISNFMMIIIVLIFIIWAILSLFIWYFFNFSIGENMNDFVLYGQWVVVVISLLGVALVSSTKHNTRLSGYIVTALGRLSGAVLFIFLDLYAFVLVNIIHTIIGLRGYFKNKKEGV